MISVQSVLHGLDKGIRAAKMIINYFKVTPPLFEPGQILTISILTAVCTFNHIYMIQIITKHILI